jgi:hypothetical protein
MAARAFAASKRKIIILDRPSPEKVRQTKSLADGIRPSHFSETLLFGCWQVFGLVDM